MIGSHWWDCLVHASCSLSFSLSLSLSLSVSLCLSLSLSLSLSLTLSVYACMYPALSQLCVIDRTAHNPRITQMTSKGQRGNIFYTSMKNISRNKSVILKPSWREKPQEDTFSPQYRHDVFWNIVPCFKWEPGRAQRCGPRSRLFSVFCFVKKLLFLDWKHIRMTCWNRISFAVPFPSFCSARKPSHGTSSPHWAPAHAGRIMDGDWNTYKAAYTAAPWTELPYVYPVSSPVRCVKTTKKKATANSSEHSGPKWILFAYCKLIAEDRQTGAEWPPSALMMTNEWVDEISRRACWDAKTREEFICSTFYETGGETVITNEYTQLTVGRLSWNKSVKRPSCARFVNEVKTTGAQTHCWHLVRDAALVIAGEGRWREPVEAITNPHSHKGASED